MYAHLNRRNDDFEISWWGSVQMGSLHLFCLADIQLIDLRSPGILSPKQTQVNGCKLVSSGATQVRTIDVRTQSIYKCLDKRTYYMTGRLEGAITELSGE